MLGLAFRVQCVHVNMDWITGEKSVNDALNDTLRFQLIPYGGRGPISVD